MVEKMDIELPYDKAKRLSNWLNDTNWECRESILMKDSKPKDIFCYVETPKRPFKEFELDINVGEGS